MLGSIKRMYPKQWVKKGLVLATLVISGALLDAAVASLALLATLLFCVASSATYIINDMHGIERDRRHSKKSKTCPLAARVVTVCASLARLTRPCGVLAWGWLGAPKVVLVAVAHTLLNVADATAANVILA